jgi:putative hemolysin
MTNQILLIILALGFEAFFSGSETALISMNILRIEHLIEKKNKFALMAHDLLKKPDRLLATTLVGTNLSVVVASSVATSLFTEIFGKKGPLVAICVMTPIALVFGELIPKTVFRSNANSLALKISFPLRFFQKLLFPLVFIISLIADRLTKLISPKGVVKNPFLTKDEIQIAVKEIYKQGILNEEEKKYIDRIFEFTLTKVGDIMVPLAKVVSVNYDDSIGAIKDKAQHFGFTRLPVFQDKLIKGVINIYDVLFNENVDWHTFIRPIRETHVNEHLDRLFALMQPNKESITVVFKDNTIVGIVTMEDLIEEITTKIASAKDMESANQ